MSYSKASKLALKAKKIYSALDSNWYCYYHALSGDELKSQILTLAHKPTDNIVSFQFQELSAPYKMYEDDGIKNLIKEKFKVIDEEVYECIHYIKEFFDDAKIEYTGRPFFNKEINNEVHTRM